MHYATNMVSIEYIGEMFSQKILKLKNLIDFIIKLFPDNQFIIGVKKKYDEVQSEFNLSNEIFILKHKQKPSDATKHSYINHLKTHNYENQISMIFMNIEQFLEDNIQKIHITKQKSKQNCSIKQLKKLNSLMERSSKVDKKKISREDQRTILNLISQYNDINLEYSHITEINIKRCEFCKSYTVPNQEAGEMVCSGCSLVYKLHGTIHEDNQNFIDEMNDTKKGGNKYKYFIKLLNKFQCIGGNRLNDDDFKLFIREVNKIGYVKSNMTIEDVRYILKIIKKTEYNIDAPTILYQVKNRDPDYFSATEVNRICKVYTKYTELCRFSKDEFNNNPYGYYIIGLCINSPKIIENVERRLNYNTLIHHQKEDTVKKWKKFDESIIKQIPELN